MLRSIVCAIIGHRIKRNRVRHDGRDFITKCRRCRALLVREPTGWRKMDPRDRDDGHAFD